MNEGEIIKVEDMASFARCPRCLRPFEVKKVVEVPAPKFLFLTNREHIIGRIPIGEGFNTMHCPYCEEPLLGGFDFI